MARTRARIDRNQPEIVGALRAYGCSVACLHQCGGGIPDLVVGWKGRNYLMEIKDGLAKPSGRKLTPDQQIFHECWHGQIEVVRNVAEALALLEDRPCAGTPV
jgi:hypothetical protein